MGEEPQNNPRNWVKRINDDIGSRGGPLKAYKTFLTDRVNEVLSLLQEKENLERSMQVSMVPYKHFNFIQKHLFKRMVRIYLL